MFTSNSDTNDRLEKNWEEIEVHSIVRIIAKDIETLEALADGRARKLANRHQCEVRWNYYYSNQGHYIQPGN